MSVDRTVHKGHLVCKCRGETVQKDYGEIGWNIENHKILSYVAESKHALTFVKRYQPRVNKLVNL